MTAGRRGAGVATAPAATLLIALVAQAAETPPTLESCAAIGAAADRLVCYDKLAGRPLAADLPPALQPAAGDASAPASSSALAAKNALPAALGEAKASGSLLSRYWELDAGDKRGTFNLVGYRPNYVLPLHVTSRINRAPQSPTNAAVLEPDYQRQEAKFQLSFRSKVAQNMGDSGVDAWLAFTQQATWQLWDGTNSRPFRNADYEPEAMLVAPPPSGLRALPFGWQWRFVQLALAHQSNGQSAPLSRSWNRVYAGTGFERGDWSLTARFAHRLREPVATDDNPDLLAYRGRADFQLNWARGPNTVSLLWRTPLRAVGRGSLQLEWTTPIFADQPNGLRWYVQAFSGYAETLTDYNFRQTSAGAGVAFMQF